MDIRINLKTIKDLCGTVSFKRGDSFYRAGKVLLTNHTPQTCEAIVKGTEEFHVTIMRSNNGEFQSSCSCPTLPNFKHSCQHTAAVLIALYELKKQGIPSGSIHNEQIGERGITDNFMTLFTEKTGRKSGHQLHFEKREVVEARFNVKPIPIHDNEYLFGIEAEISSKKVPNMRKFLQAIREGKASALTSTVKYDPAMQCFSTDVDALIHQLVHVAQDERVYFEVKSEENKDNVGDEWLLIPPSAWPALKPLLLKVPFATLEQEDYSYTRLCFQEGVPPIQFYLAENNEHYQLHMKGFNHLTILDAYNVVISGGEIFQLEGQDCDRLIQLKRMLVTPATNTIPIKKDQVDFFMKKVVPGLKKIGNVQLSKGVTEQFMKTPLIVKVYLDRLKTRLLAGLEFHYENVVIQPLESRETPIGPMIIRDINKEEAILQLMEDSGFTVTEGGYYMQNEELEYEFLYHTVPKLQSLAQVYATTAVRVRVVRENVFPKIRVKVPKDRTDWLEFKFEMDGIADKHVKEILKALQIKQKYYRLPSGSLFSLETREIEEIRRFLTAIPAQEDDFEASLSMPILEGLRFLDLIEESEVFSPEESFIQFVDQLMHPSGLQFDVPESLDPILRDYQKQGYKWMKALAAFGFGGVLADDMGLGKTLQSIAFIVSELASIRELKLPVLIVCPSSLTYNWLHEITAFSPEIEAIIIDGKKVEREKLLKESNGIDVIITSYPLLRMDMRWYEDQTFHTIFFDEAQSFKNPYTQTARAVKKLKAQNRFGLTGTPVENSLEELWSIYHVVFPQLFQGLEEYSHLPRKSIARRVRPFLLRRIKLDVLPELPQKHETLEITELLPEQKKLYTAFLAKLRHDTLKHLDQATFQKNRIRILAGLTRLRQICCHPALFIEGYGGGSAKFEQLMQILEESKVSGRRVLIFSQFTKMLQLIGRELTMRGQTFFYLDGQTPSEERVDLCNRFNDGEQELFLISLKAGGTGLNLTGADTVILYDLWWNPAVEDQAADRAYRMGQKNDVHVIRMVAKGTIEEKMNTLQAKKRNLITEVVDADPKIAMSLSVEDIREILMI
ncbi:DEAD/DEAH box helicase [Ureibacillus sinduriensis]|uniref:Helicase SNF n=1 Tax=Ureibacillus sinduriensis BLB-1 = JCM 15800 TaxID=1384057 RepID=A0A0A3HT00_9BACL|nr:DEAD/DEAH box helicase [Ureibacillus sinduriensis]KGR75716.1 helicase SNF [Ureibacillus sinduriensis BLB-1 = JCM 15800]